MKNYERGIVVLNAIDVNKTIRTHTSNRIIVITISACFPNHGLQVYNAPS